MSRESRLVKRENSMNHGSSRSVYYGVAAVAVPFLWESVPGTPKKTAGDAALLPPLTPPPGSYCLSSLGRSERKSPKRFVRCVVLKLLRGSKLSSWLPIVFPMASSPLNAATAGDVSLPSPLCFRVRRGTNDKFKDDTRQRTV